MIAPIDTQDAIFVRLPNWVGDVCMSLPSLGLLADTGHPIVVCARPWAKELLSGHIQLQGFVHMTGKWATDRHAVSELRRTLPGQARGLLLPDSLSSAAVFRLGGIPSAGYRDDGRSLLLRWPMKKPPQTLHAVQVWHYLTHHTLTQWGLAPADTSIAPTLGLGTNSTQHQQAEEAIRSAGLAGQRFVLIAPTATGLPKGRVKVWPGFRELTQALLAQNVAVAMCPPPSELEQARSTVPEAVCLPSLPLGAFATLTRMSALVVCNDSGVSHLAAAVNAPQITLFGVTSPKRTGPWSPQAQCLGTMDAWPATQHVLTQVMSHLTGT